MRQQDQAQHLVMQQQDPAQTTCVSVLTYAPSEQQTTPPRQRTLELHEHEQSVPSMRQPSA